MQARGGGPHTSLDVLQILLEHLDGETAITAKIVERPLRAPQELHDLLATRAILGHCCAGGCSAPPLAIHSRTGVPSINRSFATPTPSRTYTSTDA